MGSPHLFILRRLDNLILQFPLLYNFTLYTLFIHFSAIRYFCLDWKLEQNPVSGFLSLLRNVLHHHSNNTEQLVRGSNIAIGMYVLMWESHAKGKEKS